LPNWSNDLANSFSLSTNVRNNLPLAIYGAVLIGVVLLWPSGIQGGVLRLAALVRRRLPPVGRLRFGSGVRPDHR